MLELGRRRIDVPFFHDLVTERCLTNGRFGDSEIQTGAGVPARIMLARRQRARDHTGGVMLSF